MGLAVSDPDRASKPAGAGVSQPAGAGVSQPAGAGVSQPDALQRPVYATDGYKPFGEFTLADVRARAGELSSATGWGPTARVAAVARAWSELARAMAASGAATVADLGRDEATEFARRAWVVPPGGSLL